MSGAPIEGRAEHLRHIRSNMSFSSYAQCNRSALMRLANTGSALTLSKISRPRFRSWSSPKYRSIVWKMSRTAMSLWNAETKSQERR